MEANKTVRMTVRRIVVRPVYDRPFSRIADVFAANIDAVAWCNRNTRRKIDVIDDLYVAARGRDAERLVFRVRMRSIEKARRRVYRCGEIDLGRPAARDGSCEIHAKPSQAAITPPS